MAIHLLREIPAAGFPTDYLVARVRGRRSALVSDWRKPQWRGLPAGTSDASIWEALLSEFAWLYRQMNHGVRASLGPVFVVFEIKTVVLCLRNKAVSRSVEVERLLSHSLLGDRMRDALLREPDVRAAVAVIAAEFGPVAGSAGDLLAGYADGGMQGFESRLMRNYLACIAEAGLHPAVRRFFAAFIDLRNVMTLYKHLRWETDDAAAFIPGGAIDPVRLSRIAASKDFALLDALLMEVAGRAVPAASASEGTLETVLLASLTRDLRKVSRDSEDLALILDYVWRVYVHARNRSVLLHAGDLDTATLGQELIA